MAKSEELFVVFQLPILFTSIHCKVSIKKKKPTVWKEKSKKGQKFSLQVFKKILSSFTESYNGCGELFYMSLVFLILINFLKGF